MEKKKYTVPSSRIVKISTCHLVCGTSNNITQDNNGNVKSVGVFNESFDSETDVIY